MPAGPAASHSSDGTYHSRCRRLLVDESIVVINDPQGAGVVVVDYLKPADEFSHLNLRADTGLFPRRERTFFKRWRQRWE
jgi:hypothetical protein